MRIKVWENKTKERRQENRTWDEGQWICRLGLIKKVFLDKNFYSSATTWKANYLNFDFH